jgi:cyanophycinase
MNPHKKELLLIGGHPEVGGEIYEYLAELAAPEKAIGYIGFASTDEARWAEKLRVVTEWFAAKDIKVVDIQATEDCYDLGVIFMQGGDPGKLLNRMKETGIDELVRPAWKYGDVVLTGSSAGAMVLFWDMLNEENDELGTGLRPGMGPMSGGFVVPHFDTRISDEYKEELVKKYPDRLILGIDENTALRWKMGVCDVLGTGKITLLGRSSGVYGAGEEFDLGSTRV